MADCVLGHVAQIPVGEGRNFEVGGRPVAVFRTHAGGVYATQAACPHRHGPLADGLVGEHTVICPLHERVYDLRTGEGIGTDCRIAIYEVRVTEDGRMLLAESARQTLVGALAGPAS